MRYYGFHNVRNFTHEKTKWLEAKALLQIVLSLEQSRPNDFFRDRPRQIAESVLFLRNCGYEAMIHSGKVILSASDEERFEKSIAYRFETLGTFGFEFILLGLKQLYNSKINRYQFRKEPGGVELSPAQIPWGYLFNVSLQYLELVKRVSRQDKAFAEMLDISKHYFAVSEIQPLSKIEEMCRSRETIIEDTQNTILYDQHFAIDQISADHMLDLYYGVFCRNPIKSVVPCAMLYFEILKWVTEKSESSFFFVFKEHQLRQHLGLEIDSGQIRRALQRLSWGKQEVNKGYLQPSEIGKRNYYLKPFINIDDRYVYANRNISNYGFYASTVEKIPPKQRGNLLGCAIEDFVGEKLRKCNVQFHDGVKYRISREIALEMKSKSDQRECDFILETESTVIFIELKMKTLTSSSRSGNSLQSLIDVSQSLIHGLVQSGCHEYCLRRLGHLDLDNGYRLELNNRSIERISLTLFDFYGLQDQMFVDRFLISFLNATLSSEDESGVKKVEEYLKQLQAQYQTELFQQIYGFEGKYEFASFHNCRFYSLPQLCEFLKHVDGNESFLNELNATRRITFGSKDWFFEYFNARLLRK